jgi:WD40 repeat protein
MGKQTGTALEGHSSWVSLVALSADGKRIVSGSYDNTVRIWNAETCEQIGIALVGHSSSVNLTALSASGKRVIFGSHDYVFRLHTQEGEPKGQFISLYHI